MPILNPDPLGIQPTILPPTEGDLQKARIQRAIDLANLRNLQEEPNLKRIGLAIQQQQANEEGRGHTLSYNSQTYGTDVGAQIEREKLTNNTKLSEESYANHLNTNLITELAARGGVSNNILGEYAANAGSPALKNALATGDQQGTDAAVGTALKQLSTAKDDKTRQVILSSLPPEVATALNAHLTAVASDKANANLGVSTGTVAAPTVTAPAAPKSLDDYINSFNNPASASDYAQRVQANLLAEHKAAVEQTSAEAVARRERYRRALKALPNYNFQP